MKGRHITVGAFLLLLIPPLIFAFLIGLFSDPAKRWVFVEVGGPHGTPVQTIQVPGAAVDAATSSPGSADKGMHDETPPGAPDALLDAARNQQDKLAETDQLPIVTPLSAPEQDGCTTRLVQNFSTRRGVRPRIFVLHYTVSANRGGWSDVNAIVALFDRAAFAASSNYVIDSEGHCAYIVRESDKAWTQAAFNPVAISVEVINTGSEHAYLDPPGLRKTASVISDALCRWEIPVQEGAVSGGLVTRPGIVDHHSLGVVGGGHHDISPFPIGPVIQAVRKARTAHACGTRPTPRPVPKPKPRPVPTGTAGCKRAQIVAALRRHGGVHGSIADTVRRFQHTHHLAVDGTVGPKTGAALGLHGC